MADNITTRFRDQWRNYETAADLGTQLKAKRAAIFLACIGSEAYKLFQTLEFADEENRKDIDSIVEAFERHYVGEINITYERYVFNRRAQDTGESFDAFLSDLQRQVHARLPVWLTGAFHPARSNRHRHR